MSHEEIYSDFIHGNMTRVGAIHALQAAGETAEDAAQIAGEWIDNYEPRETGDAWSGGFAENH